MKRVSSILFIIIVILITQPYDVFGARNVSKVKRQKQNTQREIRETDRKIQQNTRATKRQLNALNRITAEISSQNKEIAKLSAMSDSLNKHIALLQDSIDFCEQQYYALRENYAKAVRSIHIHNSSLDKILFIFSSESFSQAVRRMRYLQEFSRWRERQSANIQEVHTSLLLKRHALDSLLQSKSIALQKINLAHRDLQTKRGRQQAVVNNLRSEGASLKALLTKQKRQAAALDRELEQLIAEEERRAAEQAERRKTAESKPENKGNSTPQASTAKPPQNTTSTSTTKKTGSTTGYQMSNAEIALSGSFESNKGKLPFPVSGKYKVVKPFGRQQHPELKYVVTDNGGIDIETEQGTKARAVFDGKVSAVFQPEGYHTVVMVRHGNYISIYANLVHTSVAPGDNVKAGQSIGEIYADPEDDNRATLHFEIRKEREKLNPSLWVK